MLIFRFNNLLQERSFDTGFFGEPNVVFQDVRYLIDFIMRAWREFLRICRFHFVIQSDIETPFNILRYSRISCRGFVGDSDGRLLRASRGCRRIAFLHLGEAAVGESRGRFAFHVRNQMSGRKLRRWFLLPELRGVNAVLGAASGVLVTQERRPADEVDG